MASVRCSLSEEFGSRIEALDVEWRLKKWSRAKKEALIAGDWQQVVELAAIRSTTRRQANEASRGLALTKLAEDSAPRPTSASGREQLTIAAIQEPKAAPVGATIGPS
jgi:hypothetical protein